MLRFTKFLVSWPADSKNTFLEISSILTYLFICFFGGGERDFMLVQISNKYVKKKNTSEKPKNLNFSTVVEFSLFEIFNFFPDRSNWIFEIFSDIFFKLWKW